MQRSKSIDENLPITMEPIIVEEDTNKYSFREKFKLIFGNITVEPIMICYLLPNCMSALAIQNLNLEKACRVNLNLDESVCDALSDRNTSGYTHEDEIVVQKLVASAMAWKNVIQSLLPSVVLMFLGSWSDRHNRRKPAILLPIIGEMLTVTGFLICTFYFYELSLFWSVLAEALPPAITGGWFCMFMGIFSYVSTISSVETRTLRIGAVNMISNISITIGIALSGILYKEIGFYGVFSITFAMYISGYFYGLLRVEEIKDGKEPLQRSEKGFIKDFFDLKHISETLKVAFKEGAYNRKKRICTIMILVMVIIGPMHGEMNIMYLFVRYRFGWDEIDYSLYSTFSFIVHMIGTLFSLMFFSKYLKMDDTLVGMLSSLSKIASCAVYAFAPSATVFYLGAIVECLNGTSFIAMRSIISKLVPADELGKIYSLFGVSESLMPLIYGPMYSLIYKYTINVVPGAFFLVGGVLTMPAVAIFFWLYTEHKKDEAEAMKEAATKESLLKEESQETRKMGEVQELAWNFQINGGQCPKWRSN